MKIRKAVIQNTRINTQSGVVGLALRSFSEGGSRETIQYLTFAKAMVSEASI